MPKARFWLSVGSLAAVAALLAVILCPWLKREVQQLGRDGAERRSARHGPGVRSRNALHAEPAPGREVPAPELVGIDLDGDVRISGRVLTPSGTPIGGVEVTCAGKRGNSIRRTDEHGRFEFDEWPPPEFVLMAVHPQYAPYVYGPFQVEADHELRGIDMVLSEGSSLSGLVTDSRGAPIGSASVVCRRLLTPEEQANRLVVRLIGYRRVETTDENGGYECNNLAPGAYEVRAVDADYLQAEKQTILVAEDGLTTRVNFVLEDGVAISGWVVAWDGERLPGVEVAIDAATLAEELEGFGGSSQWRRTFSDAEGRFALRGLERKSYRLRVSVPDVNITLYEDQHTAPASDVEVSASMPPRIKGRVIDKTTQAPVEEFAVYSEGGYSWDRYASAGHPDGRFELICRPGRYRLLVCNAPGYADALVDAGRCLEDVEPKEILVEVVPRATLVFRLVSAEDGRAVPDAMIIPHLPFVEGTETDENGLGRIDHVPLGRHTFELSHPDFAYKTVAVDVTQEEGEQVVDVVLDAGFTIHGRVLSRGNGTAVPGAFVFLVSPGHLDSASESDLFFGWQDPAGLDAHSDADGRFTFDRVAGMKYGLYVSAEGYVPVRKMVDFSDGPQEEVVVELGRGGSINGSVTTAGGDPVQYAEVTVDASVPGSSRWTKTNREGRFAFEQIEPGCHTITVQTDDLEITRNAAVGEGSETAVEIVLGGAALSGTITRNGDLVQDLLVEVKPLGMWMGAIDAVHSSTRTDEHGTYRLASLVPGDYLVCPGGDSGFGSFCSAHQPRCLVQIRDDDEQLDIELGGTGVSGVIRKPDGSAASGAAVTLLPDDTGADRLLSLATSYCAEARRESADCAGVFSFDGVAPGRYRMAVSKEGYATHVVEIEKRDGEELSDLRVALQQDCPVAAVVSVDEGELPYGIIVAIYDRQGRLVNRTDFTSVDWETGKVWIDGLGQGEFKLFACARGYAPCCREVKVGDEGAPEVKFDLVKGRHLAVKVVDASGQPIATASLVLDAGGGSALAPLLADHETTDAEGKATFEHVGEGAHALWVRRDGCKGACVPVDVAGSDTEITVTLQQERRE
jgi:hypothetical protein